MLKINNRKLEDQVKEILQCISNSSVEEYLIARVARDHQAVKRGKKLPYNGKNLVLPGESTGDHAAAASWCCIP